MISSLYVPCQYSFSIQQMPGHTQTTLIINFGKDGPLYRLK